MRFGAVALVPFLILAACTATGDREAKVGGPPPVVVEAPEPPPTLGINDDIPHLEAVWHLRSALNVAVLSCRTQDPDIVRKYNMFLKTHKVLLKSAFDLEERRSGGANGFDRHMTRLYNHFAWPESRTALCRKANLFLVEHAETATRGVEEGVRDVLAQLDAPYRAHRLAGPLSGEKVAQVRRQ